MNEHDAPTIARATVWLDTSHDAPTKRGERLDDLDTTPMRRATLDPDEHPTLAFAACDTETLELAAPSTSGPRPRRSFALRPGARRSMLGGLGATLLGVAFLLGQRTASSSPASTAVKPANVAHRSLAADRSTSDGGAEPATASAMRTPGVEPSPIAADRQSQGSPAAAPARDAVEALARGDYARALPLYEALAAQHPHDTAFAAIAELLASRVAARCSEAERNEGACDG